MMYIAVQGLIIWVFHPPTIVLYVMVLLPFSCSACIIRTIKHGREKGKWFHVKVGLWHRSVMSLQLLNPFMDETVRVLERWAGLQSFQVGRAWEMSQFLFSDDWLWWQFQVRN